ncbi:MAG: hypothetical protein BRD38_05400 [Bacteroidetes bacterium QH_9_67_14]|nr:MAG: hypothetical protein BRD38_05400 [Bacteroidetes bacterium QH_9_67_14]
MSKRLLLATLALLLFVPVGGVWAQTGTVVGTVTDSTTGDPLPGVNVAVVGTQQGGSTGSSGQFEIADVPVGEQTLAFSFVGYETERVSVEVETGTNEVDAQLSPRVRELEDVVVTALGVERQQRALGYSVQEIEGEKVNETGETSLVDALQGQVAGAQITSTGGAPGQSTRIVLRGVTSLDPGADNQPLFIVDGVPISNQTFQGSREAGGFAFENGGSVVNPENIESVSVLKGSSAAALYGLRAANGAIIIETKDGRAERTQVNYTSQVGFQRVGVPAAADQLLSRLGAEGRHGQQRAVLRELPELLRPGRDGAHVQQHPFDFGRGGKLHVPALAEIRGPERRRPGSAGPEPFEQSLRPARRDRRAERLRLGEVRQHAGHQAAGGRAARAAHVLPDERGRDAQIPKRGRLAILAAAVSEPPDLRGQKPHPDRRPRPVHRDVRPHLRAG